MSKSNKVVAVATLLMTCMFAPVGDFIERPDGVKYLGDNIRNSDSPFAGNGNLEAMQFIEEFKAQSDSLGEQLKAAAAQKRAEEEARIAQAEKEREVAARKAEEVRQAEIARQAEEKRKARLRETLGVNLSVLSQFEQNNLIPSKLRERERLLKRYALEDKSSVNKVSEKLRELMSAVATMFINNKQGLTGDTLPILKDLYPGRTNVELEKLMPASEWNPETLAPRDLEFLTKPSAN